MVPTSCLPDKRPWLFTGWQWRVLREQAKRWEAPRRPEAVPVISWEDWPQRKTTRGAS